MSGWDMVALADVAAIERNGIQPSQIASGTTYVGLENITSQGEFVGVAPVEAGTLASSKFRFSSRHVLFGKLRPYLAKIACPDFAGICSTDILPIRPGPRVDRKFLCYFLRQPSAIDYASSRAVGINLPRVSPSVLEAMPLPLPTVAEQRRIAEVLDRADALGAKRRRALTLFDTLKGAVFFEWFGDPATNSRGWRRATIGDLIVDGPQNGLYKPAGDYGSGVRILRIDGFYDGVVTNAQDLKRVRISEEERRLYALKPDDIVVNRVNSLEFLGKSALVPVLDEPTVFESNMMRFSVDRHVVLPRYLVQFLQTNFMRGQIARASKDAINQSSINQQDVKAFLVNVPPLDAQRRFSAAMAALDGLSALHRASALEFDALFASLQHRAFRGEL